MKSPWNNLEDKTNKVDKCESISPLMQLFITMAQLMRDSELPNNEVKSSNYGDQEKTYAIFNAIEPALKKAISDALL